MEKENIFKEGGCFIKALDISKVYPTGLGNATALKEINLEIPRERSVAIMGVSGCGKTTLLNLISGVDRPSGGKIFFNDEDITAFSERELEEYRLWKVGFIFQEYNLIPSLTCIGNLEIPLMLARIPKPTREERAVKLLELMGLGDMVHKLPGQLSGGEQQRVAIVLALVNDPPLILADEPTGNLDSKTGDMVATLLVSLAKDYKKTVIIVTHDHRVAAKADIQFLLRDGIIEAG